MGVIEESARLPIGRLPLICFVRLTAPVAINLAATEESAIRAIGSVPAEMLSARRPVRETPDPTKLVLVNTPALVIFSAFVYPVPVFPKSRSRLPVVDVPEVGTNVILAEIAESAAVDVVFHT